MRYLYILLTIILLAGCSSNYIQEKHNLMGTDVSIIIESKNKYPMEQAFQEFEAIDSLMSSYKEDSQLSTLNKNKILENPDQRLVYVIDKSIYYSILTNGSFDITVQPILRLYETSFKETNNPPEEEQIKTTLKQVNYKNIFSSKEKIILDQGEITLGGIAKGFAIDQAANKLKQLKVNSALINAGGDIRVIGNKQGNPFKIALANPDNTEEYITILNLNNISVATSGNYERYFNENKSIHHIIDPKTGKSANQLISVTVIAPYAIDADALATSVFVLGKDKGLELIESIDWAEALIITNQREIIKSEGFNRYED